MYHVAHLGHLGAGGFLILAAIVLVLVAASRS